MKKIVIFGLLIAVVLVVGCVEEVTNIKKECTSDEDCVPAQCCHPTSCVSRDQAPDCSGIFCTEDCRGGTMDCGCGYCGCIDGRCEVVWTKDKEWC